jgi:hypothetical protein
VTVWWLITYYVDSLAGESASIDEELRQKVLLGVANIFLTYANDKVGVCVCMCACVCV